MLTRYGTTLLWVFLLASALYVGYRALYVGYRGTYGISEVWSKSGDFYVFYSSGKMLVSDQRRLIYELRPSEPVRPEFKDAIGNFFNPPLFGLAYSPLGGFTVEGAKAIMSVVMLLCAAATVYALRGFTRRRSDLALMSLAIVSFWPSLVSLQVGHPSLAFMLIAAVAFVALHKGRIGTAGWVGSLLVLKPSLALAHLGLMAFGGNRRLVITLGAGAVLFGLLPFALTGTSSIGDYLDLLALSRQDAFNLVGQFTAGAAYMFNWNGFWGRLTLTPPDPLIMAPLYVLTALLMVKAWSRGGLLESWLAAALATNLALPHFLYYDLVLLLPPAFALALTRREPGLIAGLALVHLAVNVSMWQLFEGGFDIGHKHGYMVIFATPAMLLLLAYLAFEDELRSFQRRRRERRRPAGPSAMVEAAPDPGLEQAAGRGSDTPQGGVTL